MTRGSSRAILCRSARATHRLGCRLGALLDGGDVVALVGDLGAGKTQLVRGICEGAGVPPGEVSSPTFAIVATYRGRLPVHHADLYRLAGLDELHGAGVGELVGGPGALLVEWADRIDGWMPAGRLLLRLADVPGHPTWRRVTIDGAGERHAALAAALRARPGGEAVRRAAPRATPRRRGRRSPPRGPGARPPGRSARWR